MSEENVVTNVQEQPAKARQKAVRGVIKTARQLLVEGKEEKEVKQVIVNMYLAAGRTEKDAKESAAVVMHDVKHRELKGKPQ